MALSDTVYGIGSFLTFCLPFNRVRAGNNSTQCWIRIQIMRLSPCCGHVMWIWKILFWFVLNPQIFFRIRIWIWKLILRWIFEPEIFLNSASHCFHLCFETCRTEKKCLMSDFSQQFFSSNSAWIPTCIWIQTLFLYRSVQNYFGFEFWSTTLFGLMHHGVWIIFWISIREFLRDHF
jgi:hypothetical protein